MGRGWREEKGIDEWRLWHKETTRKEKKRIYEKNEKRKQDTDEQECDKKNGLENKGMKDWYRRVERGESCRKGDRKEITVKRGNRK